MAPSEHFLARLLELPRIQDTSVRRAVFRQTLVALGHGSSGPLALAGVDPRALSRCVQIITADGLLDKLDFIAPAAAASALYQLASALPLGSERRSLGRKVLSYLYNGNASTFAGLASRMALGALRPLSGAGVNARVALSLQLPSGADPAIDRMALAFVSRRELAQSWINEAATLGLPHRRLAAQLVERAARCAVKRAAAGDSHPLRLFRAVHHPGRQPVPSRPDADVTHSFASAWHALLSEREALVWRHLAIARGLLSGSMDELAQQIRKALDLKLSPTEWRRAATSLVARIAVDHERGLSEAMALLDGPITNRDPGLPLAMLWGLAPVAEVEPEAAEELLQELASQAPIAIAEGLVELRRQVPGIGDRAAVTCANALKQSLTRPEMDDGLTAMAGTIITELDGSADNTLANAIQQALTTFGSDGTKGAYAEAVRALGIANQRVGELESLDISYRPGVGAETRQQAMVLLRGMHRQLLERRTLSDLLLLDRPPGSEPLGVDAIDDLEARLVHWLLDPRRRGATADEVKSQITLHQAQLRVLIHVVDSSATDFLQSTDRRPRVRARWTRVIHTLSEYVRAHPATPLRRALIATVARAADALVRDGAAEAVDVFLYTARQLTDPRQLSIVAEASMNPDIERLMHGYLGFVRSVQDQELTDKLNAFGNFLEAFPSHITLRSEAFRITALSLLNALESVLNANSLRVLAAPKGSGETGPLTVLEESLSQLEQLVIGAERRCGEVTHQALRHDRRQRIDHAVSSAVARGDAEGLVEVVTALARAAEATLPGPIARLVREILPHATTLPADRTTAPPDLIRTQAMPLPDWLPARRILGGFYVLRQLGGGNVGSVFIVKRAEERHQDEAELFALKVPEFNATAARTMSEAEFMKLFREEAGALLSIPEHPNVARFVTFDAGAKPKPILVMELIDGISCDHLLGAGQLTVGQVLMMLDGILSGIEAMHQTGIAHLDIKPSNVIIRERDIQPVLVDFGLAGRKIRPGCATLCYGAPEIWEATPATIAEIPASAADIYAIGCVAFEMLTQLTLFDGPSDVAIISAHLRHDGLPEPIARMAKSSSLQPLAMFLYHCLRQNALERANATDLRNQLKRLNQQLSSLSWPLQVN